MCYSFKCTYFIPPGVKRACCDFLESQLDPSNCLGIRDFAETHNCLDLMQAAELFSQKHFSEVVQHEEFMLLSQTEVEKLIKCDEIQVGLWKVNNNKKRGGHSMVKIKPKRWTCSWQTPFDTFLSTACTYEEQTKYLLVVSLLINPSCLVVLTFLA